MTDRTRIDFTALYKCLVYSFPQSLVLLLDASQDTVDQRFIYVGAIFY